MAITAATATPAFSLEGTSLEAVLKEGQLEAELRWLKDENYVITASKTLEHISKTAATVTVITDREIREMGARDLMDVLSTVPGLGITINAIGAYEIEARGVKTPGSEKILVMVDGHSVNKLDSGSANHFFSNLILENIKKIEIVRGPGSAIYGANAFLGVINIISKQAADVDGVEINSGGGSYGTWQHNLMIGKKINDLEIYASLALMDTEGYKGFVPQDMQTVMDSFSGTNASKAPGYTNTWLRKHDFDFVARYQDFSFKGRYIKDDRGLLTGMLDALDDRGYMQFETYFLELSYSGSLASNLDWNAKLYRDYSAYDSIFVGFPPGFTSPMGVFPEGIIGGGRDKNTKHGVETQFTWDWNRSNKVVFGAMSEYQKQFDVGQKANFNHFTGAPLDSLQDVSSWANWSKDASRNLWAIYLEGLFDIRDNLRFTTGARYDRYSDFGGTFNPRAGLTWEFNKGHDFKFLYGRAFRAPSFNELYMTNIPSGAGNPALKPETINTLEVSLGSKLTKSTNSRITLFRNNINNLIALSAPAPIARQFENLNSVISEGVELELKTRFNEGSYLAMNYIFQNPRDKITGRLADVPSRKGNIMANWQINKKFNLGSKLFLKGSMPRAQGDTRSGVAGYGIVNSTLIARNLLKGWEGLELRFSIFNLLDKKYADPAPANTLQEDYPKPGRSFFGEARFVFD